MACGVVVAVLAGPAGGSGGPATWAARTGALATGHWPGTVAATGANAVAVRGALSEPGLSPLGSTFLGTLPASTTLHFDVALKPRNPAALDAFATAVSTPGSPSYRHFLPRGGFGARFGASPAAVAAVSAALRSAGLTPGPVDALRLALPVTGSAAAVSAALHTPIDRYRLASGRVAFANAATPRLAGSVNGLVQAVIGLDDVHLPAPAGLAFGKKTTAKPARRAPAAPATSGPTACNAAASAASSDSGWTDDQLAHAYSVDGLYSGGDLGSGTTIALFELTSYSASDVNAYQACFKTTTKVTDVAVDGGPTSSAGAGEAELDIEVALGIAPKADLLVYEAPNSGTGSYDAYKDIVDQDKAQVISTSWGQCEPFLGTGGKAEVEAEGDLFKAAAAQGQSFFAAAGDTGSTACYPNGGLLSVETAGDPNYDAIDPADDTLYVTDGSGDLSVINASSGQTSKTVTLGFSPYAVAVDTKTNKVFISGDDGDAAVVSGATCNASKTSGCKVTTKRLGASSDELVGVAVDPGTATVYFGDYSAASLIGSSESLTGAFSTHLTASGGVAVDPSDHDVYVVQNKADHLEEFAGTSCDTKVHTCGTHTSAATGSDPLYAVANPTTHEVYVTDGGSHAVSEYDGKHLGSPVNVSTEPYGVDPYGISIAPNGKNVLVATTTDSADFDVTGLVVLPAKGGSALTLLPGGTEALGVASDPDNGFAWVADAGDDAAVVEPLGLSVQDPASQPYTTSVGGTTLLNDSTSPKQTVWDEPHVLYGAGSGGISSYWAMPSWQKGPGVKNHYSSKKPCGASTDCREVPDVSASADPVRGYIVYFDGEWRPVGGTSAAAPLWAAITALLVVHSGSVKKLGLLAPALYSLEAGGTHVTTDITSGNNDYTENNGGAYPATKGYDLASGLGTPIASALAAHLK